MVGPRVVVAVTVRRRLTASPVAAALRSFSRYAFMPCQIANPYGPDTAQLAFADIGIPIHPDRRLRECDYGQLNGVPAPGCRPTGANMSTVRGPVVRATGRSLLRPVTSCAS